MTQGKPEAQEDPQIKAKREKDLETLKRDQERIEQELREAAQLAKKTAPPAPAQPPQEGKPQSAPAALSQGTTQAALAKVEEVAGDAFVVTKDGKSPATVGVDLIAGQGLETGGGASRIVLRLTDKTRVDLGPDSVLAELKLDSGKRIALTRGTVRAVVAKQPKGEPLIFTTPHGQATVVGTTLRLYVDPDPKKGTRLEVEEGKVELKNLAGKTVMVESGHYAVAAVGVELVARVGGSLTTSEGTWTFGGLAPDGISYYIQLNGAVVGWAAEMEIVGGSLYAHNTVGGHWFL
ncbi:MAG TPA: FecR domain-containing protein, partial [Planctomycetota bacterium]|nr:FecR domain-containing protein [Planctomycetota bacterium]